MAFTHTFTGVVLCHILIALKHTQAVHPAAIELDQGANIRAPQVMAVRWAIGEMFEADGLCWLLSGTLPGAWRPVELAIDGHRASDRALTRGRRLTLLLQ